VTALHTPCHTQDSICYFAQDGDEKVVFTGDTLFIGGKSSSATVSYLCALYSVSPILPGCNLMAANMLVFRMRQILRRHCPGDAQGVE
jgi:hypothetical protein